MSCCRKAGVCRFRQAIIPGLRGSPWHSEAAHWLLYGDVQKGWRPLHDIQYVSWASQLCWVSIINCNSVAFGGFTSLSLPKALFTACLKPMMACRHGTAWEGARMDELMGGQARTAEEAASMEAAAAATMHTAQSMHSAAMNNAAAAAAATGGDGGSSAQLGHSMQSHNYPSHALGPLHAQAAGMQQANGLPYQPGGSLLGPGHPHSLAAHYPSQGVQPHWPSFSLGAGGLAGNFPHVPPSRDTHGDGDQCTC